MIAICSNIGYIVFKGDVPMDSKLIEFARARRFTAEKRFLHGIVDDVYVTITPTGNMLNIYFSMSCPVTKAEDPIRQSLKQFKGVGITKFTQKGDSIEISLSKTRKLLDTETLTSVIQAIIAAAKSANALPNTSCVHCGKQTDDIVLFQNVVCPVCADCTQEIETSNKSYSASPISYLTGIIGAMLGALIGSIPWIVAYHFGWILSVLAFFIALGAFTGYKMFRGPKGRVFAGIAIYSISIVTSVSSFFVYIYVYGCIYFEYLLSFDDFKYLASYYLSDAEVIRSIVVALIFAITGIVGVHKQIETYAIPRNAQYIGKRQDSITDSPAAIES